MASSEPPSAGWRHAEGDPPGTERYWDGTQWQGGPRTIGAVSPGGDPFAPVSRPAQPPAAHASSGSQMPFSANDAKGFLSRLFDMSFKSFITTSIIKVVFIIIIVIDGLVALGVILAGFSDSAGAGIAALIIAPILFIFWVIVARIWLEIVIVLFRIHDQTAETARNTRRQ